MNNVIKAAIAMLVFWGIVGHVLFGYIIVEDWRRSSGRAVEHGSATITKGEKK